MIEILFFLVLTQGHGITVVPAPFATEASCKARADAIKAPSDKGGLPGIYAYCVRVETPKRSQP